MLQNASFLLRKCENHLGRCELCPQIPISLRWYPLDLPPVKNISQQTFWLFISVWHLWEKIFWMIFYLVELAQ